MAKRKLSSSLVSRALQSTAERTEPQERAEAGGAGSAWKAGMAASVGVDLKRLRDQFVADLMSGAREIKLSPDQITDGIGSDRREDWRDQESFHQLVSSIRNNGQDTPIQVWPVDEGWRPDPAADDPVGDTRFLLISGRRRLAACSELGLPVRAILAPSAGAVESQRAHVAALEKRRRENVERENLSTLENYLSLGELFEASAGIDGALTAAAFAAGQGVAPSEVSRARQVWALRDSILTEVEKPYDLTAADIKRVLEQMKRPAKSKPSHKRQSTKLVETKREGATARLKRKGSGVVIEISDLNLPKGREAVALKAALKAVLDTSNE